MSEHNTQHKVDTHSYKGWLNSDSFWKRAFAILGYNSAASFLIAIPFYFIMFVVMFAMMGLSSSLSDSRDKAEQASQKVNISIACLREQVVASDDLLDAGMIFGSGFAPFTGGPINYLNTIGKDEVIAKLAKLEKKHGKRFALDTGFAHFDGFKDVRGSYAAA